MKDHSTTNHGRGDRRDPRPTRLILPAALAALLASPAAAQTYETLYSFQGHPDGAVPEGALVIASNGVLYGTTQGGGAYGLGSAFELTKPAGELWKETVLHSFSGSDGQYPESTLAFGSGGVLYGTTLGGNGVAGTIFQMAPPTASGGAWSVTVLHSFPYNSSDSQNFSPNGTVLIGPGGTLYGTTQGPGPTNLGLAIALAPPTASGGYWTEYQLYSFAGAADGGGPLAGVVSEGGSLFGTAASGGEFGCNEFGCGVVFQLTPGPTHGTAWTESVLHTFGETPDDGAGPFPALTVGSGGRSTEPPATADPGRPVRQTHQIVAPFSSWCRRPRRAGLGHIPYSTISPAPTATALLRWRVSQSARTGFSMEQPSLAGARRPTPRALAAATRTPAAASYSS